MTKMGGNIEEKTFVEGPIRCLSSKSLIVKLYCMYIFELTFDYVTINLFLIKLNNLFGIILSEYHELTEETDPHGYRYEHAQEALERDSSDLAELTATKIAMKDWYRAVTVFR